MQGWSQKYGTTTALVVELGYLIDEKHRGKGFAYEAQAGVFLEEAKRRGLCTCTAGYAVPIWPLKNWPASWIF
ncbi:MAG: hypothetical protein ACLRMZ_02040 [Blautia marasmi]